MTFPILWALYFIFTKPECLRNLKEELGTVLGTRPPVAEDLPNLPYLEMVFKEATRIYPAFWGSLRYSHQPLEFGGQSFPARTIFLMARYASHRHPEYWKNPDDFIPERFSTDATDLGVREAMVPYGAGPRMCIGKPLANLACPLIIGSLVQLFDLKILNQEPADVRFGFGLYPASPILVGAAAT